MPCLTRHAPIISDPLSYQPSTLAHHEHVVMDTDIKTCLGLIMHPSNLTDRSFFGTLHLGWLRHGVAEIIKMAIVRL